nr:D-alanyl-D-alanine carboxypeptidase family protein [Paenibacillus harenae]
MEQIINDQSLAAFGGKGRKMTVQVRNEEIHSGHLILINTGYPVRQKEGSEPLAPLSLHPEIREWHDGIQLEKTCFRQLTALLEASGGMDEIVVVSGYRTEEEQRSIYEQSLVDNGAAYTASYVALPNHSEHQTGLAVDVGKMRRDVDFIAPSFPDSGECRAFKELAADYGFIQRYKEGKRPITGIACEPWHFRYVGCPHARLIDQYDFCLEEYIDFLKAYKHDGPYLTTGYGCAAAEIYFVPADNGAVTNVPIVNGEAYRLSGNNVDGFIVTAFHEKG